MHGALEEAHKQQSPYPQAVQQILERRRDEKPQPPPLVVTVPDKVKTYHIKSANLSDYDQLNTSHEDGQINHKENTEKSNKSVESDKKGEKGD